MLRLFGEGVVLFLLPFAAYAILLVAQQRMPFVRNAWSGERFIPLCIAGLVFAIFGLLGLGFLGGRRNGAYQPAHIDHGRLVPGRIK